MRLTVATEQGRVDIRDDDVTYTPAVLRDWASTSVRILGGETHSDLSAQTELEEADEDDDGPTVGFHL